MTRFTEADILTHNIKLHYYRTGGSGPKLVLAHGITDDGLCWTPVAKALSSQYDLILVDARGHGKSEAPDTGYNQATMATELAGLITDLGLKKPTIIGHSMGAATALHMAALFPDLPGAIILEDPPAFWMKTETPQEDDFRVGFITWITELKRKTRDELLAECHSQNPDWSESEVIPWVDSKHRFSTKITTLVQHRLDSTDSDAAILHQITCPVLLITADPSRGSILGRAEVERLREIIPQLQHAYIPNSGHNIRRDQFNIYIKILKDFLAR